MEIYENLAEIQLSNVTHTRKSPAPKSGGGRRSEVKEEQRAQPVAGDMGVVAHYRSLA
jgi:hypothetical protein